MRFGYFLIGTLAMTLPVRGQVTGVRGEPVQTAVVNFTELSQQSARSPATVVAPIIRQRPLTPDFKRMAGRSAAALAAPLASPGPSPVAAASFLALADNDTVVPPDTMGAVGPNHLLTMLNSQVRIQTKQGAVLSTVALNTFWASLGNPDCFDPRVLYDPVAGRWIISASADSSSPSAAVLVGVSATSDPTGNWYLYKADVDPANLSWADYDNLGFNKNWIVVTANIFKTSGSFSGVKCFVFSKADLYAHGAGTFTTLTADKKAYSIEPALTYDDDLETLYLVEDFDNSAAQLRVSTITGTVGNEVLTLGTAFPDSGQPWDYAPKSAGNILPQLGSSRGIDGGDSRLISVIYRNDSLWVAQTAYLPVNTATRTAAQWWQFTPAGTVQQFGRVDDPTGEKFFAYPSLSVNASNDVLIGYTRCSASQYASANYAFRYGADPANALRTDTVLKAGTGSYYNPAGGDNRWGDYSATAVDPTDDMTLWTIQEYAAANNKWSTWWGRINPDPTIFKIALIRPPEGQRYPVNPTITLTAASLDTNVTFTKVEFYNGATKLGETNAAPFTIHWPDVSAGTPALFVIGTDSLGGRTTSVVVNVTVGDPLSPIGTWENKVSGPGKGTAIVTFQDDFTLTGHGMITGTVGLFDIAGTWNYDAAGQLIGTYSEWLAGVEIFSGNLAGKINGAKFSATVTPAAGKTLKLKGAPPQPVLDLSGAWTGTATFNGATVIEPFVLTASPIYFDVFDLAGSGQAGSLIISTKGAVNASITNAPQRSLSGKSKGGVSLTLQGTSDSTKIKIKATQP